MVKNPEPEQGNNVQGDPQQIFGVPRIEAHITRPKKKRRRILPGTSKTQQDYLAASERLGDQRRALHQVLTGVEQAAEMFPQALDLDEVQIALIDEGTQTSDVMSYATGIQRLQALTNSAWGRLKILGGDPNPRVRKRAMHVLGFGIIDDKPADDKVKEKYKDQDKLLDNY